jgi:hypothetical protein
MISAILGRSETSRSSSALELLVALGRHRDSVVHHALLSGVRYCRAEGAGIQEGYASPRIISLMRMSDARVLRSISSSAIEIFLIFSSN